MVEDDSYPKARRNLLLFSMFIVISKVLQIQFPLNLFNNTVKITDHSLLPQLIGLCFLYTCCRYIALLRENPAFSHYRMRNHEDFWRSLMRSIDRKIRKQNIDKSRVGHIVKSTELPKLFFPFVADVALETGARLNVKITAKAILWLRVYALVSTPWRLPIFTDVFVPCILAFGAALEIVGIEIFRPILSLFWSPPGADYLFD